MILVTGATGRIGGAVVDELVARDLHVRAVARRPGRRVFPPAVETVAADLERPRSLDAALDGVDAVFLLWPSGNDDAAAEAVERIAARVQRIVYLSTVGVPEDPGDAGDPITASHSLLEQLIARSSARWTFVRSGGLAANTLMWAAEVRAESVVREPFGGIPRALVHERDLADVAVLALTSPGHVGRHHDVTGPAVVTGQQQVDAIAAAIGRPVRLEPLDRAGAIARFGDDGWASVAAPSIVDQWERMARGPAQPPTGVYDRLLGRPGRTFAQWARDHRADFL